MKRSRHRRNQIPPSSGHGAPLAPAGARVPVLFLESRIAHGGDVQVLLDILQNVDPTVLHPTVAAVPGGSVAGRDDLPAGVSLLTVGFGYSQHPGRRHQIRSMADTLITIRRELQDKNIRVVHANNTARTQAIAVALKLSMPRRVRLIYHAHSGPSRGVTHRAGLALAQRVWVCSHFLGEQYQGVGVPARKLVVVPNGYDFDRTVPASASQIRASLGIPDAAPIVVLVGRLSPNKGQHLALEAMANGRVPKDAHLVLVGDASIPDDNLGYEDRLHSMVDRLGIRGRVHLVGFQPDPGPYYTAADVVLIPSESEGFGRTALEAAAAKRPIVATPAGGLVEVLNSTCGLPLVSRDAAGLARGVARALEGLQVPSPEEVCRRAELAYGMPGFIRRATEALLDVADVGRTGRPGTRSAN